MPEFSRDNLPAVLTDLSNKPLDDLRSWYFQLFQIEPRVTKKDYLVRRIGFRLQELLVGELAPEIRYKLHQILALLGADRLGIIPRTRIGGPMTGTRIQREWNGVIHEVVVRADGFEYLGKLYQSLTVVADRITGVHQSGWEFFGLRNHSAREVKS